MLPLQALGCAKHATEKPHVLAKYDHLGILLERNMHRVIDRLDHRHLSHGSDPCLRTLRDEMRRHVAEHVVEHCADRRALALLQGSERFRLTARLLHVPGKLFDKADIDRKSTRLNSSTNAHLVCRLLLE